MRALVLALFGILGMAAAGLIMPGAFIVGLVVLVLGAGAVMESLYETISHSENMSAMTELLKDFQKTDEFQKKDIEANASEKSSADAEDNQLKVDTTLLAKKLAQKVSGDKKGKYADKNGWYFLMDALDKMPSDSKEKMFIGNLIIEIIAKLNHKQITNEDQQIIFSGKKNLSEFLKKYLIEQSQTMSIEDFKKMCDSRTILGALIDHHRWFGSGKTETRVFVDKLIEEQQKIIAASSAAKAPEEKNIAAAASEKIPDGKEIVLGVIQEILNKKSELQTPKAIVEAARTKIKNKLEQETSKNASLVEYLVNQVIQNDEIQLTLLSMREKVPASAIADLGLFAQRAEKGVSTVAAEEEFDVEMFPVRPKPAAKIASNVPAQHVQLSENALKYAEIFNQQALELYPHFDGLVNVSKSVHETLQAWKSVLRPNEIEGVKKNARAEWNNKVNPLDQIIAQPEIDHLLASVVVPKGKLAAPAFEGDAVEEKQKPKLSS